MRKILVFALIAILVVFVVMCVPFAKADSGVNSTETPEGTSVSVPPITERTSPAKTIVNPTVSEVKPIIVPVTPANSPSPSQSWAYLIVGIACVVTVLMGLTFWRKKFSRLRCLSLIFLISLVASTQYVYGQETFTVSHWNLEALGQGLPIITRESVDLEGNIWFGDSMTSRIGVLNPLTNEVKTWVTPENGIAVTITVDKYGKIWFADTKWTIGKIGQFDPSTNFFTMWPVGELIYWPSAPVISVDSQGRAYFPINSTNEIACINPFTNEITKWTIPTSGSHPGWTMVDENNYVWFAEYIGNKIARLNPQTNEMTEWTIPTDNSRPVGLYVVNEQVFFVEYWGNKVGRLNTLSNEITQWSMSWFFESGPLGGFVDTDGNFWFRTAHYLLKLSVDNIFTYWWASGDQGNYLCGVAIDTKINIGDVYLAYYHGSSYYGWYGDIYRFHTAT
jgi:virginiamycin B lyase